MSDAQHDCVMWAARQLSKAEPDTLIVTTLVKRRAWSTVWKLETPQGRYYLKKAAPGFDIEAPLLAALCCWRPAAIVELLAVDAARGWVLTRDAGRLLHDVMFDDYAKGQAHLRSILLAYAALQADSRCDDAPSFMDMLEDRSPTAMSRSFAAVVEDEDLLRIGGVTADELDRRSRWIRNVEHMCADAAALNLPVTLEHGDLHTSNIMVSADGTPRIADWGDACLALPLHSLVQCLDDIVGRHKIAPDDPWLILLTEDYFHVWRRRGYDIDFHRALAIVRALTPVSGVLQWSRGIDRMDTDARSIMAGQIVKRLRALA